MQAVLFGYDFFISYRSADGSTYARSLHQELTRRGFDCFLDVEHYEAGHNLRWMQTQALRRSRKLLVIVTPRAHVPPPRGTDWLLAEVLEYKRLASLSAAIVPIGTPVTLSGEQHQGSKLLPEIPTPGADDICIFDDAVERDAPVSQKTISKLDTDFHAVRRRRVRQAVAGGLLAMLLGVLVFGAWALRNEDRADRERQLVEAFRLLDRGREAMEGGRAGASLDLIDDSRATLERLGFDQLMALHFRLAASLRKLDAVHVAKVDREVSHLVPSRDGRWLLVVHDYQAPNGGPDIEDILDQTAFAVFDVSRRRWSLRQTLRSAIGMEIYQGAPVVEFDAPEHVIMPTNQFGQPDSFARVSLVDGSRTPSSHVMPVSEPSPRQRSNRAQARLSELLSPERLYSMLPEDGIDRDYGPRLVDLTHVESPDGRTAIVGTYEGRLMLLDLVTGLSRGEIEVEDTVYTAAFSPDGSKGYVCDASHIWEVNASGWAGVEELKASLPDTTPSEAVLAVRLSDDAATLAVATTRRLLVFSKADRSWKAWPLPGSATGIAAMAVDHDRSRVDLVVADDGTLVSINHRDPSAVPDILPRPRPAGSSVAWLDPDSRQAWIADARIIGQSLRLWAVGLPGAGSQTREVVVPAPWDSGPEHPLALRGIVKHGPKLHAYYGDDQSYDDSGHLDNEQMLSISLDRTVIAANHVLFESRVVPNGPDRMSVGTQVSHVLPSSLPGRMFVNAEFGGTYLVHEDGVIETLSPGLFVMEHVDRDQRYSVGVQVEEDGPSVSIRHAATGTALTYPAPWSGAALPTHVAITANGRHIALANRDGDILLMDVSSPALSQERRGSSPP